MGGQNVYQKLFPSIVTKLYSKVFNVILTLICGHHT